MWVTDEQIAEHAAEIVNYDSLRERAERGLTELREIYETLLDEKDARLMRLRQTNAKQAIFAIDLLAVNEELRQQLAEAHDWMRRASYYIIANQATAVQQDLLRDAAQLLPDDGQPATT